MSTHFKGTPETKRALGSFIKLLRGAQSVSLKAGELRHAAGLTEAQFGALEALQHRGPLNQSELATKLLSSTSNLTVVIDNLERDGLVRRRTSPEDRRCHIVSLTTKGRRVITKLFPQHAAWIVEIMSVLSAREQVHLGRLCRKVGLAACSSEERSAAPLPSG